MEDDVKEKSKNKILIISVIILAIIFVGTSFANYYFFIKGKYENEDVIENMDNDINENIISNEITNETNSVNTNNTANNTVNNTVNKNENKNTVNTNTTKNTNTSNTKNSTSKDSNKNTNTNANNTNNTNNNTNKTKVTKTGTDESKELTKSETKYGVKINTYTIKKYDVYSDGSKKETKSSTTTEYDRKGYKASTSELLPEAKSLKSSNSSLINGVLKYVNEYRKEVNVKDLTLDSNLTVAACARAMEMAYANKFSHTRPNGSSCFTILDDMNINCSAYAENIAYGYSSAKSVSEGWKKSSGHYKNMINANYGKIGIGVIKLQGTYYWVQLFTN